LMAWALPVEARFGLFGGIVNVALRQKERFRRFIPLRPGSAAVDERSFGSPSALSRFLIVFRHVARPFAPIKNPVSTSAGGRKAGRGKPGAHTASLAIYLTWLQAGRPKDHGMVRGLPLAPLGVKGGLR